MQIIHLSLSVPLCPYSCVVLDPLISLSFSLTPQYHCLIQLLLPTDRSRCAFVSWSIEASFVRNISSEERCIDSSYPTRGFGSLSLALTLSFSFSLLSLLFYALSAHPQQAFRRSEHMWHLIDFEVTCSQFNRLVRECIAMIGCNGLSESA